MEFFPWKNSPHSIPIRHIFFLSFDSSCAVRLSVYLINFRVGSLKWTDPWRWVGKGRLFDTIIFQKQADAFRLCLLYFLGCELSAVFSASFNVFPSSFLVLSESKESLIFSVFRLPSIGNRSWVCISCVCVWIQSLFRLKMLHQNVSPKCFTEIPLNENSKFISNDLIFKQFFITTTSKVNRRLVK